MEDWEKIVIGVALVLVLHAAHGKLLDHWRDVHDVYLQEQSTVGPTRRANESATYSSNKLVTGLRGGLEIRYDHYKIRSGNLRDIWELLVARERREAGAGAVEASGAGEAGRAGRDARFAVNGEAVDVAVLNANAQQIGAELASRGIKEVLVDRKALFQDAEAVVVLVACFISQVTVHVTDRATGEAELAGGTVWFDGKSLGADLAVSLDRSATSLQFPNAYDAKYDQGVPLRVTSRSGNIVSRIDFTHANFASAVAAFLKHLPESHAVGSADKLLLQYEPGASEAAATIVKMLGAFVAYSRVEIVTTGLSGDATGSLTFDEIRQSAATVVALSEASFVKTFGPHCGRQLSTIASLRLKRSLQLLSQGIFSTIAPSSPLRLVYISRAIGSKAQVSPEQLNVYRALLGCRIIVEHTFPNVAGPIIQTDFYDYRVIHTGRAASVGATAVNGYGCLSQSLEIKLVNAAAAPDSFDGSHGDVYVRGYNIGKLEKQAIGLPSGASKATPQHNEGFMPLGISGRWGRDGCLYV